MKISLPICLWLLALSVAARGDDEKPGAPVDDSAYETDRPGEVENPFALPAGQAELVNYVVEMNAAAREDEFGGGGSAVFLDSAVRFGLANRLEGAVAVDTFLQANASDDGGDGAARGIGYATVLAKWNFLKSATGDFGLALAPFMRLPLGRAIGGSSRAESGLAVPFDVDLEGGWELEGSVSVSRAPETDGGWSTQGEAQTSLERTLTASVTVYVELQADGGEGPPEWATEFGVTDRLSPAVLVDVGGSVGLGRNSRGRMAYAGVGWSF